MKRYVPKYSVLIKYKKIILIYLTVIVAFGASILSSYIVGSYGCGWLSEFIDCGYYAGFPLPYAVYDAGRNKVGQNFLVNPTFYYKYRYSPLPEERIIAEKLISEGKIVPFFLSDMDQYKLNTGLMFINSILWIAPIAFLFATFF